MTLTRHQTLAILAPTVLAMGLVAGCGEKQPSDELASEIGKTLSAQVLTVQFAPSPIRVETPGTVASEDQIQVASRLMGYIREMKVQEGQTVRAGQLLFVVDPSDIQGQMSQARAGLAQSAAALADAQSDYERFGNLYKEDAIPKVQWDKVRMQYQVAQQQVAAAQAGLNMASSQMHYASVTTPIAGTVTQKMANAGDLATPGLPVVVIEGLGKRQVRTSVSDEIFAHLRRGDAVNIRIDGKDSAIKGTIAQAISAADPVSHTHLVKVDLPKNSGLESGTFVRVGFSMGEQEDIRIPDRAVVNRVGITGVFVVDANGITHFRMVRVGAVEDGLVDIQAGLSPGERIAVSQAEQIANGDKIIGGPHE
ncbi:MAG: efflux RND transporter periplasmic adaptor subunit [Thiobacillaceae bacterium]